MTTSCRSISLAVLAIAALGGTARAAETPLLVAVEVAPGVDDLVAKLSVHLPSTTGESGSFVSPTVGVRLRLL